MYWFIPTSFVLGGSNEGMKSCREISLWIWNVKAEPGTSSMEHSPFKQFQSGGDAKMMVSSRWLFRSHSQPVNHQSEEWPAGKKLSTIAMPCEWITIKTLFHRRGRSWNRDTPYSSNLFDSITCPRDNLLGCHMKVLPRHQGQQPEFFREDPNHQWSIKTTGNHHHLDSSLLNTPWNFKHESYHFALPQKKELLSRNILIFRDFRWNPGCYNNRDPKIMVCNNPHITG